MAKGERARSVARALSTPSSRSEDVPNGATCAADAALAYVPRILLESLAAHPGRAAPWYDWVEGTLIMADVSGFTALSERLAQVGKEGAEWLTDVINRFFGRMLDVAWDCGGTTLTFGGDAILLLFYGEDHERRGIAAALRMLHETQELSAHRVGKHRVKLSMSMGAHAGEFLVASAGTHESTQFLILGPETVKTAQAEAQASSGELAITRELAQRVGPCAVTASLGDFFRVERLVDTPRYSLEPDEMRRSVPTEMLAAYLPSFIGDAVNYDYGGSIPELGHEHRNVTVAFVNVLGVDDLLSDGGPSVLTEELQRYFEPVVRLIREHHGYLVSNDIYTNGFKLIVAFGAPVAHEHDAENAFRFAATLRDEIGALDLQLTHRIGVNGGFVYAGDVGPAYRRQYTIMGDAVNLSARLMSAAEPGQVIVSARSAEAAGDCFIVRELAPVRVKGKEHPVAIGALEGQCEPAPFNQRAETGFFGREAELSVLARAREEVEVGRERVVVVRGEAGMGKSRLTGEFERELPERGWSVHIGRSYQHTQGQPFAPWIPVLSALIRLSLEDDDQERSRKTLLAVEQADPDLAEWASLLNPLLGLSLPQSDLVRSLDANGRRDRMFDLVAALLRHAARSARLLVHLEDVHWADRSSLQLIERIAAACRSSSILLLITERFEGASELDLPPDCTATLDLTELPRAAAIGLLEEALGTELPDSAAGLLLDKTKGNPLFLQEVARSIGRSGLAAEAADERDLVRRMESVDVPDRVQGLLMSQVDALSLPERELLRTASVLGTTFPVATLRSAFGGEQRSTDLDVRLQHLVEQSLIVESPASRGRVYDFRHALIQEVAYESLPFAKRRDLHHRVAEYLEQSNRQAPQAVYESLVHHYSRSGDKPKTRAFAVKAGEKALGLLASDQAVDYFRLALEFVSARTAGAALARSFLLEDIGDCYHVTGRHHQAAESYKSALKRSGACRDCDAAAAGEMLDLPPETATVRNREARLSHKIGVSYTRTHGDYNLSLRWLDRATQSMRPRDAALTSSINATRSVALLWMGDYDDAIQVARRAYSTALQLDDRAVEGRAATVLAGAYQELGNLKASIRYRMKALESYEAATDVPAQAEAHSNLSATYICRGDLERALYHAREALKIDERTGDVTGEGITRSNLAEILIMRGEYQEATRHLGIALDLFERAGGATHMKGFALMMLSRALARQSLHEAATARLDESMALLERSGATTFLAEARVQRAEMLLAIGRLEEALTHCARGLEESRALGMRLIEIRGLWLRGRILGAMGDSAAAELDLLESADLARRVAAPYERGVAQLSLAELYAVTGRSYQRALNKALELLEPTGAAPELGRAHGLAAIR